MLLESREFPGVSRLSRRTRIAARLLSPPHLRGSSPTAEAIHTRRFGLGSRRRCSHAPREVVADPCPDRLRLKTTCENTRSPESRHGSATTRPKHRDRRDRERIADFYLNVVEGTLIPI